MNSNDIAKRIMENTPTGRRKVGRVSSRWTGGVLQDIKSLKTTVNWWMVARNRQAWRNILKEDWTKTELLSRIS